MKDRTHSLDPRVGNYIDYVSQMILIDGHDVISSPDPEENKTDSSYLGYFVQDAEERQRVREETSGMSCLAVTLNSWQEKGLDKQAHMFPLPLCEPHPGLGASPGFQQEWKMAEHVQAGSGGRA